MPRSSVLPEPLRAWTRRVRALLVSHLLRKTNVSREPLSYTFLRGRGIEIGALNNPMPVGPGAHVSYVDRLPREELIKLYQDVDPREIRPVDIVTDGETLASLSDDSQDFVIANHMVEHCQDPIGTLRHMLRVLKVGGILYLTLPDKRFTFDRGRPVTLFEEVRRDYLEGPENSLSGHYMDWLTHVEGHSRPGGSRE
jgi:SAM-dependent methyltransferase